jgi:hypothetical protein
MTDGGQQASRQIGPLRLQRRGAVLDRPGHRRQRHAPEGMLGRERLPEQDSDPPHIARRAGFLSAQPLRRDVRQRPGHVADRGQRLRLVELREPEVQQAHRDAVRLCKEDVGRLHIAVDDPALVGVGKPFEDLGRRLDRVCVAQLAGAHRVAQGLPGHVLVGDVDVAVVGAEVVGAQAALVAQAGGRLGLAFGSMCRLALARDDLERDVEAVVLVAAEPDGT